MRNGMSFAQTAGMPRLGLVNLAALVRTAAEEMDVDVCSLYWLEGNELVMRATCGLPEESVGRVRMLVTDGLTGYVFSTQCPLAVSEPALHPRYRHFPMLREEQLRSYLGVPLPARRGVMVFQTRGTHFFTSSEIQAAVTWASSPLLASLQASPR